MIRTPTKHVAMAELVKDNRRLKYLLRRLGVMTVKKLIEILKTYDEYDVVVCMDENGGWDNIQEVKKDGSIVSIVWGGGSPFSDE